MKAHGIDSTRCSSRSVDTADHDHAEGLSTTSSKDEIPVDIQQLGFTNPSLVTEDGAGYASLQRELDGYERLRHPAMEVKNEVNEYLGVLDDLHSLQTPSSSTRPKVYIVSDEVEGKCIHLQNQSHEYLELVDGNGSLTVASDTFISQAEFMEASDEYSVSRSQSCLYEEIPESLVDMDYDSGNNVPEEQYAGCVSVVDYADSLPTPKNKHEVYVDVLDYSDPLPCHSEA